MKYRMDEITESCLGKMLDSKKNKGEYQPYLANKLRLPKGNDALGT